MASGFLAGAVWGGLVSVMVVGGASLISGIPGENAPQTAAVDVPAGSEFDQARVDTAATLPRADNSQASQGGTTAPRADAPPRDERDDIATLGAGVTDSTGVPEIQNSDAQMNVPQEAEQPAINTAPDAQIAASERSSLPQTPLGEPVLSISTDPSQPVAPSLPEIESAQPFAVVDSTDLAPNIAAKESDSVANDVEQVQPQQPVPEIIVVETPPAAPIVPAVPTTQTLIDAAVEPDVETAQQPQKPETTIIASVAKPFGNLAPNVATNRLPALGSIAGSTLEPTAQPIVASNSETGEGDQQNLPPIERFAVPFENPSNKPLMAIVLIDDGTSPIGLDALSAFPYPISFAIDTAWDGAQDAMITYRAAGFEVLAMVDMVEDATASDAETAMAVHLSKMTEVVGVMEGVRTGFQGNREASDQVTDILLASGHGWVLFPKGLNTVQKLAVKAGVPAGSVFRDFDGQDQNASAIRRFLGHAALKAGQQNGGVIMVGRIRADTISALLLWGLQDRASSVSFAPISAVLTNK